MLIGLVPRYEDKEKTLANFEEVQSLVHTFGGSVHAAIAQNSARADSSTYIGTGKTREAADVIIKERIDIVVINDNIKASQLYNLKKIFEQSNPDILVWDRVDLILQIFSKHASTVEAKLQIKLANIRHMGPQLYGMGLALSQQGGGIGTRGIGETNTEIMRRHWRNEIKNVQKQLKKLTLSRHQQMARRKKTGLLTISIVGYTNAGKTTLFNRLSKKSNLVESAPFTTLDSSVSKFFLPAIGREVLLSDTIGFIQNLPPQLIDAFKSTLMETVNANLLLHVIDISDFWRQDKTAVVEEILHGLTIDTKNQIYVFNKIDIAKKVDREDLLKQYDSFHPQFISAKNGAGCVQLINAIQEELASMDRKKNRGFSLNLSNRVFAFQK